MKISYHWLKEWVNVNLPPTHLAEQLTLAGLEVDECCSVAQIFTNVCVAEIKEAQVHPDADKLKICKVDIGDNHLHTVVCAAANAVAGIKVPYAKVGSELHHSSGEIKKIAATHIRGVLSNGMLCSAEDLGMAENSEGLLVLPADAPLGKDIRDYLLLDDVVLDLQITPNRGDCLSVLGLAREIGALNRISTHSVKDFPQIFDTVIPTAVESKADINFPIKISDEKACICYAGRLIRGIDNNVPTPLWMQERLRRAGTRSISLVVDVMNYVMLEIGQPLHAFDFNTLNGHIEVRFAKAGETLTLLNQQSVTLSADTLLIADNSRPLALAGIMGGLDSSVTANTTDIFIECANFVPEVILGRARRYGLQTDGAHRFERGVDPALILPALERATALLMTFGGGIASGIELVQSKTPRTQPTIVLTRENVQRVLGAIIPDADITDILQRLGMTLHTHHEGWTVTPPTYRYDIFLPEDVIEEIARIYGYTALPTTVPHFSMQLATFSQQQQLTPDKFSQLLISRAYQEVITYSFIDPAAQKRCEPQQEPLPLLNPIASDLSVMRTSLWPGLLQVLQYNANRQQSRARCFEHGLCFIPTADKLLQQPRLAGVVMGTVFPENWKAGAFCSDFYAVKADVLALLSLTQNVQQFLFLPSEHPALHPGQTAIIKNHAGECIGYVGAIHPQVLDFFDLKQPVYAFELRLENLNIAKLPQYHPISVFPQVRRDLAFVLSETFLALDVRNAIEDTAGPWLIDFNIFDVYQGKGIPEGQKSLAIGLTLQHPQRTLTDEEVDEIISRIVRMMQEQFAAELRK